MVKRRRISPPREEVSGADRIFSRRGPIPEVDEEIIEVMCELAEQGCSMVAISNLLGIPQTTISKWIVRGRKYMACGFSPKEDRLCYEFERRLRRAAEKYLQSVVQKHRYSGPEWTKWAWLLERRDPKTWGRKDLADHGPISPDPDDRFV